MKVGDQIKCPHCGADSFLKKESVMDGWTKIGEVLKCASCSAVVGNVESESAAPQEKANADAMERLRGFLNTEVVEKPKVNLSDSDKRFCKDCFYLVKHPFILRCSLDSRSVNPMDDCPKFKRAPKDET